MTAFLYDTPGGPGLEVAAASGVCANSSSPR